MPLEMQIPAAKGSLAATAALLQPFAAQQHLPEAGSTRALSSVEAQPEGLPGLNPTLHCIPRQSPAAVHT